MEAFALYLLKSVVWLSSFTLIFFLFLRNERFFFLNRIFLMTGIISSFVFPLLTLHYAVNIPVPGNIQSGDPVMTISPEASYNTLLDGGILLFALYLCGVLFVASLIIKKSRSLLQTIRKAEIIISHEVKLIRTPDYDTAFSFFSYVFVNPSVTDIETKEIVNHELAHIRQKHWIDLVLVELLCVLQWFNPLIWIYIRFIRQNHEYLADEVALQHTSDPAVYRATLLNQIVGTPVVSLANSFNYSLNKKRFNMMKNIITSPYRKMKIFLILPVCAIVLYAFAKPEYRYTSVKGSPETKNPVLAIQNQVVKGIIVQEDGTPLPGASVLVKGTTMGTVTDLKGYFALEKLPSDAELVVSFVGFQSKVIKAGKNTSELKIIMIKSVINIDEVKIVPPPPPPPPAKAGYEVRSDNNEVPPPPAPAHPINMLDKGLKPLIIIDGKEVEMDLNKLNPNSISSINVLKGGENTNSKYGEKGKNGVIIITTKSGTTIYSGNSDKNAPVIVTGYATKPDAANNEGKSESKEGNKDLNEKVVEGAFVVVEEMPSFPGGSNALSEWISSNMKYPVEAAKNNISGQVSVGFTVTWQGKVKDVRVIQPGNPLLDAEAIRVISNMPDWNPGKQGGKPVAVIMRVPINFSNKKVPVKSDLK
jgi:TonB family protein